MKRSNLWWRQFNGDQRTWALSPAAMRGICVTLFYELHDFASHLSESQFSLLQTEDISTYLGEWSL